jgi:hypothetical protein
MLPEDLLAMLTEEVLQRSGDNATDWSAMIGPIYTFPRHRRIGNSWGVNPGGSAEQQSTITKAIAAIQAIHPVVKGY